MSGRAAGRGRTRVGVSGCAGGRQRRRDWTVAWLKAAGLVLAVGVMIEFVPLDLAVAAVLVAGPQMGVWLRLGWHVPAARGR